MAGTNGLPAPKADPERIVFRDMRAEAAKGATFEPPHWRVAEFERSARKVGLREIGFAEALAEIRRFMGDRSEPRMTLKRPRMTLKL